MEPTIEKVRDELRMAIYWTLFRGLAGEIEGRTEDKSIAQNRACFLLEFGVNCKLITPTEANEWLDAVWERVALATPFMKYREKPTDTE